MRVLNYQWVMLSASTETKRRQCRGGFRAEKRYSGREVPDTSDMTAGRVEGKE